MRKLCLCLFYAVCVFTIVFSLFWMALPRLEPAPDLSAETPPGSEPSLAAQTLPDPTAPCYILRDTGGRVAVYRCGTGSPDTLEQLTGIYVNLLPENDALRVKRGIPVYSRGQLQQLLEDLGG